MPIAVENLTYVYHPGTPWMHTALAGVDFVIEDGSCWGIIGATGSGKSTLIQHLNGLLRPTGGRVVVDGTDTSARGADLHALCRRVGLVFQYPEQQLFAETVFDDIAFGPRNFGLDDHAVRRRVHEAAAVVGVGAELLTRSPFALSGGQARRVALAGVLAMQPRVLVLDEPMAGLDPLGRQQILGLIRRLHRDEGLTVILVSHSMDDIAGLADQVLVLHGGRVLMQGPPRAVFSRAAELEAVGLGVPAPAELVARLAARGWSLPAGAVTIDEAVQAIAAALGRRVAPATMHEAAAARQTERKGRRRRD